MFIAKLRISMKDANIQYNKSEELGTDKARGTVLADGKIIRGLGTHFANQESKLRFDRLTSESNRIRDAFNHNFMKLFSFDGAYIIAAKDDAKNFLATLTQDPELDISVVEFELNAMGLGLNETEMREWAEKVKTQIERVQIGRGKQVKDSGLDALTTLSNCPALSKETAEAIRTMVGQVRIGQISKLDFQRSIELLDVKMDQSLLIDVVPQRAEPIA